MRANGVPRLTPEITLAILPIGRILSHNTSTPISVSVTAPPQQVWDRAKVTQKGRHGHKRWTGNEGMFPNHDRKTSTPKLLQTRVNHNRQRPIARFSRHHTNTNSMLGEEQIEA